MYVSLCTTVIHNTAQNSSGNWWFSSKLQMDSSLKSDHSGYCQLLSDCRSSLVTTVRSPAPAACTADLPSLSLVDIPGWTSSLPRQQAQPSVQGNCTTNAIISTHHATTTHLITLTTATTTMITRKQREQQDLRTFTPPPQPFYGPFSGTTRVSRCQKRTSGLYGAREH